VRCSRSHTGAWARHGGSVPGDARAERPGPPWPREAAEPGDARRCAARGRRSGSRRRDGTADWQRESPNAVAEPACRPGGRPHCGASTDRVARTGRSPSCVADGSSTPSVSSTCADMPGRAWSATTSRPASARASRRGSVRWRITGWPPPTCARPPNQVRTSPLATWSDPARSAHGNTLLTGHTIVR
jgi:hypothetical protein